MTSRPVWAAVILSGGASSRMKADKARLKLGSQTLLQRTVHAVESRAQHILISGDRQPIAAPVTWCPENPPRSGPVAALATALPKVSAPWVMILPCDLADPRAVVEHLLQKTSSADAVVGIDPAGHIQWLTALVKTEVLGRALQALDSTDVPVRKLYENINISFLDAPANNPHIWEDMDTPEDFANQSKEFS